MNIQSFFLKNMKERFSDMDLLELHDDINSLQTFVTTEQTMDNFNFVKFFSNVISQSIKEAYVEYEKKNTPEKKPTSKLNEGIVNVKS